MNKEERMLKSMPSNDEALIKFVNNSSKHVDIIWLDFNGAYVRFASLRPEQFVDINTFSRHLWKSFDRATGSELLLNGQTEYNPVSLREMHQRLQMVQVSLRSIMSRTVVSITASKDNLYRLCQKRVLQFVSRPDQLDGLVIPQLVREDLRKLLGVKFAYMSKVSDIRRR